MGMYTELNIAVTLRSNTPDRIVDTIRYMIGQYDSEKKPDIPAHPLFLTSRWGMVLCGSSYYFGGLTNSIIKFDHIARIYNLNVRSSIKNYDSEIELFLNFIAPYIETCGFLGYMRYEEYDYPTLIWKDDMSDTIELHTFDYSHPPVCNCRLDDRWLMTECKEILDQQLNRKERT